MAASEKTLHAQLSKKKLQIRRQIEFAPLWCACVHKTQCNYIFVPLPLRFIRSGVWVSYIEKLLRDVSFGNINHDKTAINGKYLATEMLYR